MTGPVTAASLGVSLVSAAIVRSGLAGESLFTVRMAVVVFVISLVLGGAGMLIHLLRKWSDIQYQRWLNTPE